jgi:hypothetical protein
MLRLDHQAIRQSEGRQVVARHDRENTAAMTTRGSLGLRDLYKVLSVEVRTTMGEFQLAALRLMLARFKGHSTKAERRKVWEAIQEELASYKESEGDD